jgi:DNA (cytosine-5)-methyltransferase 1
MNELPDTLNTFHFFAGAGGGILADILLGHNPIGACEIEPFPRKVLFQRQRDGILPAFPIWDDIRTFDGKPWRGLVDVVAGGFPCQDISSARTNSRDNGKQRGLSGTKSSLWFEMERCVEEMQPRFVFIENSPNLRTKGLDVVLQGLDRMGYDTARGVFQCGNIGADHYRKRMFILAHTNVSQRTGGRISGGIHQEYTHIGGTDWWKGKSGLERVAHGMANWVDRLKAIGNGQVPIVAATAWQVLSNAFVLKSDTLHTNR